MSLPPLRERTGDLFPLTRHFLHCHTDSGGPDDPPFSTEARTALREYPWPGNVRQLKNVVVRAACRRSASTIERGDLLLPDPQSVPHARPSDGSEGEPDGAERPPLSPGGEADASAEPTAEAAASPSEDDILSLQEIKKRAVKHAYEMFDGDVDQAAVALDIGRSTMYRMLKRHDLREDES
jgi:DNA-binding NtrC family response regulator